MSKYIILLMITITFHFQTESSASDQGQSVQKGAPAALEGPVVGLEILAPAESSALPRTNNSELNRFFTVLAQQDPNVPVSTTFYDCLSALPGRNLADDSSLNEKQEFGMVYALIYAVMFNNISIVRKLIENGVNPNIVIPSQKSALMYALEHALENKYNSEIIDLLFSKIPRLEQGQQPSDIVTCTDNNGNTLLHYAAKINKYALTLIKLGAQINVTNNEGKIPLAVAIDNKSNYAIYEIVSSEIASKGSLDPIYLNTAVENGDIERVKVLLAAGVDVNAQLPDGKTALFLAILKGNIEIVNVLLAAGADVKAQLPDGKTALFFAILNGDIEIVNVLLAAGADVNAKTQDGNTALHFAVDQNKIEVVKVLLAAGVDVNAKNKFQITALHLAVDQNKIEIVKALVAAGADVMVKTCDGIMAIHIASLKDYPKIIQALIPAPILLHQAVENNDLDKVKELLAAGADVNAQDDNGRTILHMVSFKGNIQIVQILLNFRNVNVNIKDNKGQTALHCAAIMSRNEIVEMLLAHGADVNIQNLTGHTALHCAAVKGCIAIVTKLLSIGRIAINSKDNKGQTALHHAVIKGHTKVVKSLLAREADINAKDDTGLTPLDYARVKAHIEIIKAIVSAPIFLRQAVEYGNIDMVKESVAAGANINAQDDNGLTVLHIASDHGYTAIVQELLAAGADINAQDNTRRTALDCARVKRHIEIIKTIVSAPVFLRQAVEHGNIDMVKESLAAGANINAQDKKGRTVLQIAVANRNIPIIEVLLADPNVNARLYNNEGKTAIAIAGAMNNIKIIMMLTEHLLTR